MDLSPHRTKSCAPTHFPASRDICTIHRNQSSMPRDRGGKFLRQLRSSPSIERSSSSIGQWMPYPPGESCAAERSSSLAADSFGEHFSQGIKTRRSSRMIIRPSRVVSILFAVSGSVAFTVQISKNTPPFIANQLKVIEDNLPDLAPHRGTKVVSPSFLDLVGSG